jgi:hypothetical protein
MPDLSAVELRVAKPADALAWLGNTNAHAFYLAQGYQDVGTTLYMFEEQAYENRIYVKVL